MGQIGICFYCSTVQPARWRLIQRPGTGVSFDQERLDRRHEVALTRERYNRISAQDEGADDLEVIEMDESAATLIEREVLSWPEVSAVPHRFGGTEFRVRNHEIGHLHGSTLADLPFPVRVREELIATGRASVHHVLPDSGWVSYYLRQPEDVPGAIALFRLNYERLTAPRPAPASKAE